MEPSCLLAQDEMEIDIGSALDADAYEGSIGDE
jgi:hypothetical protein